MYLRQGINLAVLCDLRPLKDVKQCNNNKNLDQGPDTYHIFTSTGYDPLCSFIERGDFTFFFTSLIVLDEQFSFFFATAYDLQCSNLCKHLKTKKKKKKPGQVRLAKGSFNFSS